MYSFSVFSHLPEPRCRAWLAELARITNPEAVLVLTTMGEACIEAYRQGRTERPTPDELASRLDEIQRSGFCFFPYESIKVPDKSTMKYFKALDLDQYGSTFILEPYIRSTWTESFEIIDYAPSPDGWQDFVTLRRR